MALDPTKTLKVGAGNYFIADPGTAKPADLMDPEADDWTNIGHTSAEEILNIATEGGDITVLGSLQNSALRTTRSALTDNFGLTLLQWDEETLKLYYGSNATTGPDGAIRVPSSPQPTTKAFLAVFLDQSNIFHIYAPNVEISRGDAIDISDTESLAGLPLNVQPLAYQSNTWTYEVSEVAAYVAP